MLLVAMLFSVKEAVGKLGQSATTVRCRVIMLHPSSTRRPTEYVAIAFGVKVSESDFGRMPTEGVTDHVKLVSVG